MRGSLVVLALAVTPLAARVSDAQVRSHAVRHVTPIAHRDDDKNRGKNDKNDDKKCERGNPSQNGKDHRRADPPGMKDCNVSQQGGGQTPPPPPPPSPDPAPTPAPDTTPTPAPTPDPVVGHTTVYGSVFFDIDHDGMLGPDEVGESGWTVQISGPVTLTTLTDGNGGFSFTGLTAGIYTVCVIPPMGWTQTPIMGQPSCGPGLYGYTIDASDQSVDIGYTGIDFGFVSN
jgi:hypothetical protein